MEDPENHGLLIKGSQLYRELIGLAEVAGIDIPYKAVGFSRKLMQLRSNLERYFHLEVISKKNSNHYRFTPVADEAEG